MWADSWLGAGVSGLRDMMVQTICILFSQSSDTPFPLQLETPDLTPKAQPEPHSPSQARCLTTSYFLRRQRRRLGPGVQSSLSLAG